MGIKLYFDAMSQPSRALLIFMRMNKNAFGAYEEIPIALRKGEQLNDEYKKVNPFGKVPAIDHDGFKLTESVAIFRYLCRTFPVSDQWYPKDPQKMSRVDEYMSWQHLNLRINGGMYFQLKFLNSIENKGKPSERMGMLGMFESGLENACDQIEEIWLKDKPFVTGSEMTIADLLCVTELEQPIMAGFNAKEGRPLLEKYMNLVRNKLNPIYDEVHSVVYKVGMKSNEEYYKKLMKNKL